MIHQIAGKFVIATYLKTKGRFMTSYTKTKQRIEATSLEGLRDATLYDSRESAARAIRKRRISR
jgi:hypothetical protein